MNQNGLFTYIVFHILLQTSSSCSDAMVNNFSKLQIHTGIHCTYRYRTKI